ncbi:Thivi_2564 family membrane protein [Methylosarcina fibrata]|uniref:Thivi_2564 family membrane protein n=1 Tax=Methylosarcina fibrata TaxID=105972 RepID=UPI0003717C97
MDPISIIIGLIVIGIVLWLVNTYIPMDPRIKQILNIVVIIVVVSQFKSKGYIGLVSHSIVALMVTD